MGAIVNKCRRSRVMPFHSAEFEVSQEKLKNAERLRIRVICLSETHRLREDVSLLGPSTAHTAPLTLSHELFHSIAKLSTADA